MNKKNQLLIALIGILVVATIGISFAYYITTINVEGNGTTQTGTAADLMEVVYDAGTAALTSQELIPGSSLTKDFSVKITPKANDKEATIAILFQIDSNTFKVCDDTTYASVTNECERNAEELVIILKDKDTGTVISTTNVTGKTGEIKLATISKTVETQTTFNYTIELKWNDTNKDQNHNQNATITGSIKVEFAEQLKGKDLILSYNTIDTSRSSGYFPAAFTDDTAGRIFSAEDDDGTTYFFAGSNPNNWVKFGANSSGSDLYWRIIRINGDGSIRLIYNGTTTDQTGATTQIGTSYFNECSGDNTYVGYMYGTATGPCSGGGIIIDPEDPDLGEEVPLYNEYSRKNNVTAEHLTVALENSTYAEIHANINSSTIKTYLDTWYEENLKTNYEKYIDTNAGFCGDRTVDNFTSGYTGDGSGKTPTQYAAFKRAFNTYTATYKCSNSNDYYTVRTSNKGNKALENPIGLITSDEVMYAGGYKSGTQNHWLKTGQNYWTMSPSYFNGSFAFVLYVYDVGYVDYVFVDDGRSGGARPVISLKADTLTLGSGTTSDPFRIA